MYNGSQLHKQQSFIALSLLCRGLQHPALQRYGGPGSNHAGSGNGSSSLFPSLRHPAAAAAAVGSASGGGARHGSAVVYETWLIQELMDGGALSSALYGGRFRSTGGGKAGKASSGPDMVRGNKGLG